MRCQASGAGGPSIARRAPRASGSLSTASRRTRRERGLPPAGLTGSSAGSGWKAPKEPIRHPSTCHPGFLPWITKTMRGAKIACRTRFCRGLSSDSGRRDVCHLGRPHHQEARQEDWLKRGVGIARAPSPDARCGHPWPPLARSRLRSAFRAALVGYAGSRSTGDPSLQRKALCGGVAYQRSGEAGIGERLRSDEVLRETTKLLPAPPTYDPQASHPQSIPAPYAPHLASGIGETPSTTHSG